MWVVLYSPHDYMNIAVVHDWLNGMRGGERVLEAILEVCPNASIYTLFHERGKVSEFIESHRITTSWLDRIPGIYHYYRNLLPLFPSAVASWDLSRFDLVISSSHAVAKGVRTGRAVHICYCHTPMRYLWDAERDYSFKPLQQLAMSVARTRLREWDCETARRVDHFVANSRFIQQRIQNYYGRDSEVIYPPVDTKFFTPSLPAERGDFYLAAGALVPYKRLDLVIAAFNQLEKKLVVAGSGPQWSAMRKIARRNIEFRGWVTDEELRRLYGSARALVTAAREDFGIAAVEARACGCPVIAFGAGGSAETVQDGVTGICFAEQHVDNIVHAVRRFERMAWPVEQVQRRVEIFSRENFQARIRQFIGERLESTSHAAIRVPLPA
jgi:glycosyltransferase involved in cell wall biosynthesis